MLAFVSNKRKLKKSWRIKGEMTWMHVFIVSWWCVAFWHAFVKCCTGYEHTIFPRVKQGISVNYVGVTLYVVATMAEKGDWNKMWPLSTLSCCTLVIIIGNNSSYMCACNFIREENLLQMVLWKTVHFALFLVKISINFSPGYSTVFFFITVYVSTLQ
jgi:hypothetical protein